MEKAKKGSVKDRAEVLYGLPIKTIIDEVRKVTPVNRTTLRDVALVDFLSGKTIREIAQRVQEFKGTQKLDDVSDKVITGKASVTKVSQSD